MRAEDIKNLAEYYGFAVEHVSYLAPTSMAEGVYHVYVSKLGRNTPVLGDTLDELYTNVRECCLKLSTGKTSLS